MPSRSAASAAVLAIFLIAAAPASAANRYIDDSGSDTGDCSHATSPCKSINYALGQGNSIDTYLVGGGTYAENVIVGGKASLIGSDFKPPATSGVAIVDGGGGVGITASTSGQIAGLTIRGNGGAIVVNGGSPTITHDTFDSVSGTLGRVTIQSSGSAQVLSSTFTFSGMPADPTAGVYANTTGSVVVAGSSVSNLQDGIRIQNASSTIARDNAIAAAPAIFGDPTGIEVDNGIGTLIRNRVSLQPSSSGDGMALHGGDMTVRANMVTGAHLAAIVTAPGHLVTMDSDVVTGNDEGIGVQDASTGLKLVNDTVVGNGPGPQVGSPGSISIDSSIIGGTGVSATNGCTITFSRGPTTSGNSCQRFQTSADPKFVSPTDLRLQPGSPMIDAGNPLPPANGATDADGHPRVLDGNRDCVPRRDIGAYEFRALCAPPKCTVVPKSSKVSVKHGVISLKARCDEKVRVSLAGTVKIKRGGKTRSRKLGPSAVNLKAGITKTLKLKLPKSARTALANGAKESARFMLTATNGDAETGTAKAKIKRLKPKR